MSEDVSEKKVITRAQAKALGLSHYFTGKPCKHGHVAEQTTNKGNCVECNNLKNKKYRKENIYEARERERLWRKNNPLKVRAKRAAGKARKRNAEGRYTAKDIEKMLLQQNSECNWCKTSIENGYHVDHVRPLAKGGSNWPNNLQLLCAPCNQSKSDKDMEEWALEQLW